MNYNNQSENYQSLDEDQWNILLQDEQYESLDSEKKTPETPKEKPPVSKTSSIIKQDFGSYQLPNSQINEGIKSFDELDELEQLEENKGEEADQANGAAATDELDKTEKPRSKEEDKKEDSELQVSPEMVSTLLSNTVAHLIEQGIWEEWEGWQDVEWTEEMYAEAAEQQAVWKIEDEREQTLSQDTFFKAVKDFTDVGGDPEKMIELFVQQYNTKSEFDTSTDEGKKGFVIDFMVKHQGLKKGQADRLAESEVEAGTLDEFYNDIKSKSDSLYQKKQEDLIANQAKVQAQKEAEKKNRQLGFQNTLKEQKFDPKYANELYTFVHKQIGNTPDGQAVTAFEWEFIQAQRDPKKLVKLAQFLKNPDKYDEIVSTKEVNKQVDKTFKAFSGAKAKTVNQQETPKAEPKVRAGKWGWM